MTFQTTDIPVIIALVLIFIAVSVITGIITYKIKVKGIKKKTEHENEE